jgi:hypothetical protein
MPLYDTREESGRVSIRLRSHQLAEQDIQDYGAIERSDLELAERARHHIAKMQAHLPTPQAILTDDAEAFAGIVAEYYRVIYKGLLVAYTGLQEPYRLTVVPRYTTSVNLDDSEDDEHPFTGLAGLQAFIRGAQALRRKNAQEDRCSAEEYLLTMVQVTIYDAKVAELEWHQKPRHFICYELDGDQIVRAYAQSGESSEVLAGLGLPFAESEAKP